MQKIVIIGSNGQLAHDLLVELQGKAEVVGLTHAEIDIVEHENTRIILSNLAPQVIINTAAYHRVDEMEDNIAKSFAVNADAIRNLALISRDLDAVFVHYSTDYVFGGDSTRQIPYSETDAPYPINVYGVSKLAGEYFARDLAPKHFVIRSSGLYGVAGSSGKGGNFIENMIGRARDGKTTKVVADQRLTPTFTIDLAQKTVALIQTDAYGLYHLTNTSDCSWYEFAETIYRHTAFPPEFGPTTTAEFGAKATRPPYSVLDNHNLRSIGLAEMRPWQEALQDYLGRKGYLAERGHDN